MDETFSICETCRERVEPGEPGVLEAAEMTPAHTFGGKEWIEGLHVFFHEGCYPQGSTRYKIVPA